MPNIAAIYDPDAEEEAIQSDLSRMVEAIDFPGFGYVLRTASARNIACANLLTGVEDNLSQPAYDSTRSLWLMLDGELLNTAELRQDLERLGFDVSGQDDAQIALSMYVAYKDRFLERLSGNWNLLLHDPANRRLLVASDPHGSRPLFYAHDGSRLVLASELKAVITGRRVQTQLGGLGLLQLLFGGAFHRDHTWAPGIRVMPPGTRWDIQDRTFRSRRYFELRFWEGPPEMSEASYADGFARELRAATERCLKGHPKKKVGITLSGGLDSRSIALSIPPVHFPLRSWTYGNRDSADVRYAAQLAALIGFEHEYIEEHLPRLLEASRKALGVAATDTPTSDFYSCQLDRIVWRSEGLSHFDSMASALWHPVYAPAMRVMLNGAAGDALTGSHLRPEYLLASRRAQIIDSLWKTVHFQTDEIVRAILNPTFFRAYRPALEPDFRAAFESMDADEPTALASLWDMEYRQRRGTFSSFAMERYFCTCRAPFLDKRLSTYLSRVPGRFRFQQRVYKRMLVHHYPEAAHVPWAYVEGRITASPLYEFARESKRYLQARLRRSFSGNRADARWAFRDPGELMKRDSALHEVVERFTRSDFFPSEVFDAQGLRALADRVRNGSPDSKQAVLFGHIVGLARCAELFLSQKVQVPPSADPTRFGVRTKNSGAS